MMPGKETVTQTNASSLVHFQGCDLGGWCYMLIHSSVILSMDYLQMLLLTASHLRGLRKESSYKGKEDKSGWRGSSGAGVERKPLTGGMAEECVRGHDRMRLNVRTCQQLEVCVPLRGPHAGRFFEKEEEGGQLEKQIAESASWPTLQWRNPTPSF